MDGLKNLRDRRMMTQREVASGAGITVATLSGIENGKSFPKLVTIRKLASVFGLTPEQMRRVIELGELPF